ncbi:MAG: response regulator [Sphingomonas sp.]|uniref:response regulator n=1 Tax=Sphingomonas sp. TaxID=28214 RepID=UPI001AD22563|nr:response regulator [Sphingomonas sp.]MBN8806635.1 response regulator [Sphingomonas sp.]
MIRALFVDDDPDLRTVTRLALQLDSDFAVETAESAHAALALLRKRNTPFDLILLGATTRDMDQAMVEAVRWLPACRTTPIVFLSRRIGESDRAQYRAMGAAGVIAVPYDPTKLACAIAALLHAAQE